MRIVIGGDLVPTSANKDFFFEGNLKSLLGEELQNYLCEEKYKIFNLECPITNECRKRKKCGINISADPNTMPFFVNLHVDLLSIANNHIMDFGEQGLNDTISLLRKNNISIVGAGANCDEASQPFYFHNEGRIICVISCAEHEFSIAGPCSAGANGFDITNINRQIADCRKNSDYLIILYHGGKEYYRYPSPMLQTHCHEFIDSGADLVVCQHSHCIGAKEDYKGKTIVYGQGNFIFNYSSSDFWKTSILIEIDESLNISYIPIIQTEIGTRMASAEEGQIILNDFLLRSEKLLKKGFIEKQYQEFAQNQIMDYLEVFLGKVPFFQRVFMKVFGKKYRDKYIKSKYSPKAILQLINYLNCESHIELICTGLETICYDK